MPRAHGKLTASYHYEAVPPSSSRSPLKERSGIDHIASGNLSANGVWLCATVLAHT